MKKQPDIIPIFFSTDDGYAPFLGVALYSLIQNASDEYRYQVIILYENLSDINRNKLSALATDNVGIQFVPMEEKLGYLQDRVSNRLRADYFTPTIYFRIFIPAMFPEYDKAIYVDSDIIVPGDISELYLTDIGDHLLGAVPDYSIWDVPLLVEYLEKGVGIAYKQYINSGILLMNAKKLREVEMDRRFLDLMNTYQFPTIAPDQDYLNAMCYGKVKFLSKVWDAMPVEGKEPMQNPKLIHYNLFAKPWCYDQVQYEEYFWHYAKETEFYDQILKFKSQYSDADKQSDSMHLELMLTNSQKIVNGPVNFRKVFNEGNEKRL